MQASEIQLKKNRNRLVFLIVLIVATITTSFLVKRTGKSAVDKNVFRNGDLESVDKILIQNSEDTTELVFQNARWRVNDQWAADRKYVTLLFATFKQAEPKREITSDADSVSKYFQKPTSVTLYSGGEIVQQVLVASNAKKTQTFFKDPKTEKMYLMHIPGYRVYVAGIFETQTADWRDKFVFGDFNWRNFQSLETKFSEKNSESFRVKIEGAGLLGVEGIKTDTAKLNAFLYDLSVLTVDKYLEATALKDSLLKVAPFMTVTIEDIGHRQQVLRIYREEQNRILGLISDDQAVIFNSSVVRNIIRPKSFFKQK